ncbi:MAG: glycosyl hydrolase 108 family protein [Paludibacter sp.]|nr:glycosyl hydrolase 108 family protein [Paludibacter sp.]
MAKFNLALLKVLSHEGGYVNDPDDLGGETYKGIARNSHSSWSGWQIIDKSKKDKSFPVKIVNDVNLQQLVEQFYFELFWQPLKADQIQNQTSAESVFDFAVNSGLSTSVRLVQSIAGTKIDGIIGAQTLNKINSIDFGYFQAALTVAKIEYYMNIIRRRPTSKKFLLGWISRSLSFND